MNPPENEKPSAGNAPNFPQYPTPAENRTPFVDRKVSAPLWKLAKFMMKPHQQFNKSPMKKPVVKKEKRVKYY